MATFKIAKCRLRNTSPFSYRALIQVPEQA